MERAGAIFAHTKNRNLIYLTQQSSQASCFTQISFGAFANGVQLISGSPYAETE